MQPRSARACVSPTHGARVVYASPTRLVGGRARPVSKAAAMPLHVLAARPAKRRIIDIAAPFAHRPPSGRTTRVFDRDGNLYVTYSGTRGQQVPVSIFRVRPNGTRETFSSGIVNPTSMALGCRRVGCMCRAGSRAPSIAWSADGIGRCVRERSGVACGLAFRPRATAARCLSAIDRGRSSGSIARDEAVDVRRLPPSVAAFHLAFGPDAARGALRHGTDAVVAYDALYRIDTERQRDDDDTPASARPQGWRSTRTATLLRRGSARWRQRFVSDPVRGRRSRTGARRVPGLVGVAFDADLAVLVVSSNDTAYRARAGDNLANRAIWPRTAASKRRIAQRSDQSANYPVSPTTVDIAIASPCLNSSRRKPIARADPRRRTAPTSLKRIARRRRPDHAGDRRGHRRRDLRRDRHRRGRTGRAQRRSRSATAPARRWSSPFMLLGGACALAALCYAELAVDDSAGRQRLRLLLRDARRAGRVDHRLGPDPRIRRRQRRRRDLVGRLLQHTARAASASVCRCG